MPLELRRQKKLLDWYDYLYFLVLKFDLSGLLII